MGISELLLSRLWCQPQFLPARGRCTSGQIVEIVYRGRWSHGSGPDFRDALLMLGNGPLLRGEVEVHVRASDWDLHGHGTDSRYDSVILHAVLWDDRGQPVSKSNGEMVPTLALSEHLAEPWRGRLLSLREGEEEMARLEADLLGQPWPGSDVEAPCAQRPPSPERLARLLEEAGEERLRAKAARLEGDLAAGAPSSIEATAEQVLYAGLAEALGYRANQRPFRQLAAAVPLVLARSLAHGQPADRYLALQSLFFGAAGLLPSQRPQAPALDWEAEAYAEELEQRWLLLRPQWGGQPMRYDEWTLAGVRPPNYPTRRLAALARIVAAHSDEGLLGGLLAALQAADVRARLASLVELLEEGPADAFWSTRCDFGRRYLHRSPRLVGKQRADDIVVNILLPFALAWADWAAEPAVSAAAREAYRAYPPLAENEITREMLERLVAGERKVRASLAGSARRQQGLLHLYRLYCGELRCLDCPVLKLREQP